MWKRQIGNWISLILLRNMDEEHTFHLELTQLLDRKDLLFSLGKYDNEDQEWNSSLYRRIYHRVFM